MKIFLILLISIFTSNSYAQEFITCTHKDPNDSAFKSIWLLDIDSKVFTMKSVFLKANKEEEIEIRNASYLIFENTDQFIKSFINHPEVGRVEYHLNLKNYELYNKHTGITSFCESNNKKDLKEVEENLTQDLIPIRELEEAYIFYLIIKNLNKNNLYGSDSQIDDTKKLIKKIENFYKKQISSDFDIIWDNAKEGYLRKHAGNVDSLSSSYSVMGKNFFDINMIGLIERAKEIGFSSSNTDKDF